MNIKNEVLACFMFMKIIAIDNWARIYLSSTPKLFDLSKILMTRIQKELPDLHSHLFEHQIYLEVLLASPLMTLFSNMLDIAEATHVLSMFILDGESFIMNTIFNIYKNMSPNVLKMKE